MIFKLILLGYCIMAGVYGTFYLLFAEEELPLPVWLICFSIFLLMLVLGIKSFRKKFKLYYSPDYEDLKREQQRKKDEKRRAKNEDWDMEEHEDKKLRGAAKKVGKVALITGGIATYLGIGIVVKLTSKYMKK